MRSFVYLGLLIAGSLLVKGASAETDAPALYKRNYVDVNGSPHVKCFIIKHGIKFEILEGDCKPHTSVLPDSLEVELNFTMAQMDDASVAGGAGDEEGGGLGDVSAFWKRAKRDLGSETGDQDEEGILVEDDADHSRTFKEVDEDGTLLGSLEGDVESQIEGQGNDEPDAPESDDAEFLFEGQGIDGPDAPESDDAEFPVEGQGVDGPDAPESGDSAEINESTIDEPVVETSVLSSKKAKDDVAFNDEETAENAVAEEAKIVVLDEEHESETSSDSEDDKEIDGEIDETLERDAEGDSDGWQDIEDAEAGPSVLLLSLGALGLMAFFSLFAILRRQKRKIYVMIFGSQKKFVALSTDCGYKNYPEMDQVTVVNYGKSDSQKTLDWTDEV